MNHIHIDAIVNETLDQLRFDIALAKLCPEYSRSVLKKWIQNHSALLDGKAAKPSDKVKMLQKISIHATLDNVNSTDAQAIALNIIYEDADILIINKPAGLVVHPGAGNKDQTLQNALLFHHKEAAHLPRAGIIHRIDKDTSGLLVVAKTLIAHHHLTQEMQQRRIKRKYLTLVQGEFTGGGSIDQPIARDPHHRTRMAVHENGREAITHYRIKQRFDAYTLLEVTLETGRTHQIRVHMAFIKHPIIGDLTYAGRAKLAKGLNPAQRAAIQSFPRQALHAAELELQHPRTLALMHFEAPLPEDFADLLTVLQKENT